MIFRKKSVERRILLKKDVLDGILSYCQMKHPDEAALILKGRSRDGKIRVDGLVIPPFEHTEPTFAGIPHSFLPFDMSYVGIVHSRPSGPAEPTATDLNNFFGLAYVTVRHPYGDGSVSAWDSSGNPIPLSIVEDS